MKTSLSSPLLSASLLLASLGAPCPAAVAPGQVWFQADFNQPAALAQWSGVAKLEAGQAGGHAVALEARPGTRGATISKALPVADLRGWAIRCSAMVRAEEISAKPHSWNGLKVMLCIESPGGTLWPQAALPTGTLDWRRAGFFARIPSDATNLTLVLGLEEVTGKAWFEDVKLVAVRPPVAPPPRRATGAVYKGHELPRLRGTMISPAIDPESLRVLGQDWKANLIRWQLTRPARDGQSFALSDYETWIEGELRKLEAALPLCERLGLFVVVDLHSPPGGKGCSGGYVCANDGLFTDKAAQDKLVEVWRAMALRFKAAKPIWGYDLVNEPVEDDLADGCDDWPALAERVARAIRAVDPQRTLIVEPAQGGAPSGLMDLPPLRVSNVVYSVHMYEPGAFTHQGVFGAGTAWRYPGQIEGEHWDKAELERALQPAIDFQERYGAHIYIGEFSAIRWAPDHSAARYLSDLIDIFEAHGWDWTYHAFREWNGWSVEHGPDREDAKPAASPTDRQQLLTRWFARNQKPRMNTN